MKSIAVDTGGTFTDIVVLDHDSGSTNVLKVPSTPSDPGNAIVTGLSELFAGNFLPSEVTSLSHGTTVGTNMLLTGKGSKVGLLLTAGFGGVNDVWQLPRQEEGASPEGLYLEKHPPVPPRLRGSIPERMDFRGNVVRELDTVIAAQQINKLARRGAESIAIVLLFSFMNPKHEQELAELVQKEIPGCSVSLSSRILPQIRERPRLSTTVANARLASAMETYLAKVEGRIRDQGVETEQLYVMQSNGGVAQLGNVTPVTTVLSGPCAGALAGMQVAATAGYPNAVSLDMGGTSTDIALGQDGRVVEVTSGRVGDWEIALPMLMINTIGAGGGTIARLDAGGGMRVGPESAGADPGPACYGKGGAEATVTDANLVLGLLNPDRALGGRVSLNHTAALEAVSRLGESLGLDPLRTAEGIIRITDAKMAEGIRAVSTERGYDLREFALVAFGGAGPVPSGRIAADLKMSHVIVPASPGVTSAMGLLMADVRRDYVRSRIMPVSELPPEEISSLFGDLESQARIEFSNEGFAGDAVTIDFALDMRYSGQGYELTVPAGLVSNVTEKGLVELREQFDTMHEQLFGHSAPLEEVEVVNYRARATAVVPKVEHHPADVRTSKPIDSAKVGERDVCFDAASGVEKCRIYDRDLLEPGHSIQGPAIIEQLDSTSVVYPGQNAVVDPYYNLVIQVG